MSNFILNLLGQASTVDLTTFGESISETSNVVYDRECVFRQLSSLGSYVGIASNTFQELVAKCLYQGIKSSENYDRFQEILSISYDTPCSQRERNDDTFAFIRSTLREFDDAIETADFGTAKTIFEQHSKCWQRMNFLNDLYEELLKTNHFEQASRIFNIFENASSDSNSMAHINEIASSYRLVSFLGQALEKYLEQNRVEEALEFLMNLDQPEFFKSHVCATPGEKIVTYYLEKDLLNKVLPFFNKLEPGICKDRILVLLVEYHKENDRFEEALALLKQFNDHSEKITLARSLIKFYISQSSIENAIQIIESLDDIYKSIEYQKIAEHYIAHNNPNKALEFVKKLNSYGVDEIARPLLKMFLEQENLEMAKKLVKELYELKGFASSYQTIILDYLLDSQKNPDEAYNYIKGIENFYGKDESFEKIGLLYLNAGDYGMAREVLNDTESYPNRVTLIAEIVKHLYKIENNFDEAIEILRSNPESNSYKVYNVKAEMVAYYLSDSIADSKKALEVALLIHDAYDRDKAVIDIINFYLAKKSFQEAETLLEKIESQYKAQETKKKIESTKQIKRDHSEL